MARPDYSPIVIGQSFSRLIVKGYAGKDKWGCKLWLCICQCGTERQVSQQSLKAGKTKSCGCLFIDILGQSRVTHHKSNSLEYGTWLNIKQRCTNKNIPGYKNYGGRGITLSKEWEDFSVFLKDMGERPGKEYSIERKNNTLGYSKENCIWATRQSQARNTRRNFLITIDGQNRTLEEWSEISGIHRTTLASRIRKLGWETHDLLKQPRARTKQSDNLAKAR